MSSSPQTPGTRKPMKTLCPDTFTSEFENLHKADGRNSTYLCFEVKTNTLPSPDFPDSGIFQNQDQPPGHHAELVFLAWFFKRLRLGECYQVTWYISWSPCSRCADQVANFLKSHGTVRLRILASRLYFSKKLENRRGLHRLSQARAEVKIMSLKDFEYCWENFVNHEEKPFQPWMNLDKNSEDWNAELKNIHRSSESRSQNGQFGSTLPPQEYGRGERNPRDLLTEGIFYQQFNNKHKLKKPYYKRKTYLCYELNGLQPVKGCFHYEEGHHAESQFIEEIGSMGLDQGRLYFITCYFTWSPCHSCARKLVSFVKGNSHLCLKIYTSRLYYHWIWKYIQGLQHLQNSDVPVTVMTDREFEYCWKNFVDNKGMPFEPWEKLDSYSKNIEERLKRILEKRSTPDDLNEVFRNLYL
ncbi:DNA dC-_dU-editing enzyme APOBEC-3B-like [Elephas maximus indicus]|uniref:DNA dC->dU-editing enzyme APOBEC-3B-like n=1 Tax=Elephas maximus indicus TaxID=99487 RepID=UPI0021171CA7|nr:DNA dC->dU-editing enzyme APOBEC-3B-like [Elephas maximus indicus]